MKTLTIEDIYDAADDQMSTKHLIGQFKKLLRPPNRLIHTLQSVARYHDEPFVYQYSATPVLRDESATNVVGGMGTSFSQAKAQIKALGEAIERSSLLQNFELQFMDRYLNLPNALKIAELPELYQEANRLGHIERSHMPWVKAYEIDVGVLQPAYIPAQLIFVPYKRSQDEPIIRQPITTGAALGISYADSLLRGTLEVIERDAFMLSYYQKTLKCRIDIGSFTHLRSVALELERCKLQLHLLDISSNTGAYVFLSILIDETGYGPPITAGLRAGYDPYSTALSSIEESIHVRSWIRDISLNVSGQRPFIEANSIATLRDRALFWLNPELILTLDFYLQCQKVVSLNSYKQLSPPITATRLQKQLTALKSIGTKIYFADLTTKAVSEAGFRVTKVVITKLQPLHLDERYALFPGPRFSSPDSLNDMPHFFL